MPLQLLFQSHNATFNLIHIILVNSIVITSCTAKILQFKFYSNLNYNLHVTFTAIARDDNQGVDPIMGNAMDLMTQQGIPGLPGSHPSHLPPGSVINFNCQQSNSEWFDESFTGIGKLLCVTVTQNIILACYGSKVLYLPYTQKHNILENSAFWSEQNGLADRNFWSVEKLLWFSF